ncbi:hypothetical protein ASF53_24440 [Methylobacterium sp. Leaf123]|nr:hypothetical protein ASF53_24440 [Methylobacterium sp. Leaf123]
MADLARQQQAVKHGQSLGGPVQGDISDVAVSTAHRRAAAIASGAAASPARQRQVVWSYSPMSAASLPSLWLP